MREIGKFLKSRNNRIMLVILIIGIAIIAISSGIPRDGPESEPRQPNTAERRRGSARYCQR